MLPDIPLVEKLCRKLYPCARTYAAYLHGASQWDGTFEPIAENGVAVYIFMAENDEYYGSGKARDAYNGLHEAYLDTGLTESQIEDVLCLEIPDNEYFNSRGIYNYHGGGNILFQDKSILNWIIRKKEIFRFSYFHAIKIDFRNSIFILKNLAMFITIHHLIITKCTEF